MEQMEHQGLITDTLKNERLIKLNKALNFRDTPNRNTSLEIGSWGVVLNEGLIKKISTLSIARKQYYIRRLQVVEEADFILALVEGYICAIHPCDFDIINDEEFLNTKEYLVLPYF
jgi:hypothetical protein